jgi:hypothetical protein
VAPKFETGSSRSNWFPIHVKLLKSKGKNDDDIKFRGTTQLMVIKKKDFQTRKFITTYISENR